MSVNELSEAIKEEQSKISHNLTKLAKCSILKVKKEGKKRIYSLNKETITPLLNLVKKHVETNCNGRCKHDEHIFR